eukprot:9875994-Lingulodinium_polyedra.AAC.1
MITTHASVRYFPYNLSNLLSRSPATMCNPLESAFGACVMAASNAPTAPPKPCRRPYAPPAATSLYSHCCASPSPRQNRH